MNGTDLLEALGDVDEGFIHEAEHHAPRVIAWRRMASLAACVCLLAAGLYALGPRFSGPTEGSAEQAQDVLSGGPGGGEHKETTQPPAEQPEEVPAVILHVDEMTAAGFTGTVAELVDTDIFEPGMELNVVLAAGTRHETTAADAKTDYAGRYVMVQFIAYDRENGTIVANLIEEIAEKG